MNFVHPAGREVEEIARPHVGHGRRRLRRRERRNVEPIDELLGFVVNESPRPVGLGPPRRHAGRHGQPRRCRRRQQEKSFGTFQDKVQVLEGAVAVGRCDAFSAPIPHIHRVRLGPAALGEGPQIRRRQRPVLPRRDPPRQFGELAQRAVLVRDVEHVLALLVDGGRLPAAHFGAREPRPAIVMRTMDRVRAAVGRRRNAHVRSLKKSVDGRRVAAVGQAQDHRPRRRDVVPQEAVGRQVLQVHPSHGPVDPQVLRVAPRLRRNVVQALP